MHRFLILFACCLAWGSAGSQVNTDSLFSVYERLPNTKAKVDTANAWNYNYGRYHVLEMQALMRQNLQLADRINYPEGEAATMVCIGKNFSHPDNLQADSALFFYKKALRLYLELGIYERAANTANEAGITLSHCDDFEAAIKMFKQALSYSDSAENLLIKSRALGNLGDIYRQQNQYKIAEENFLKALKIKEELNDHRGMMFNLNSLFMVKVHEEDYDGARKYLGLIEDNIDTANCVDHLNFLTKKQRIFFAEKDFANSIRYSKKALKRGESCPPGQAQPFVSHYWLARAYYENRQFENAVESCYDVLDLLNIKQFSTEQTVRMLLADAYKGMGNLDSAASNWKQVYELERKLANEDLQKAIGERVNKYRMDSIRQVEVAKTALEFEKRKAQEEIAEARRLQVSEEQQKNRYLIIFLLLLVLVAVGLFFLLQSNRRAKKKIEQQSAELKSALDEKEVLMREIHHRVKNNLQSISSMLRIQKRRSSSEEVQSTLAESLGRIQTLSKLHAVLYQQDSLAKLDVEDYVDQLIGKVLAAFDSDAKVDLELSELNLDQDQLLYFGFILNEWITNAIKYAAQEKLELSIRKRGESVVLKDNGKGYDPDKIAPGFGLNMMDALAKKMGGAIQYDPAHNETTLLLSN